MLAAARAVTDPAGKFTIGKQGFQYLLRRDIGDTNDTANVIRLIRDTAKGDYAMLPRFAERRYAGLWRRRVADGLCDGLRVGHFAGADGAHQSRDRRAACSA